MDPMDYTMDSPPQHHEHAARCQYLQAQPLPQLNTFITQRDDGNHYDPVHNTWYHQPTTMAQTNPHIQAPTMPQWNAGFAPNTWASPGGARATNTLPAFRSPMGEIPMSFSTWASEQQNYDPPPAFPSVQLGNSSTPHSPTRNAAGRSSAPASATITTTPQPSRFQHTPMAPFTADFLRRARPESLNMSPQHSNLQDRQRLAHHINYTAPEQTSSFRPSARYTSRSDSFPAPRRRRMTPLPVSDEAALNSDDEDDESGSDLGAEVYQRNADYHINPDSDRERFLAFARGRLAAASGKRVPSKDAIASFARMKLEDLPKADRSCIICYNDFGIENPEGVIEEPIRLPKCRHIFGDKCIKEWFEDNDSCPYCRDKLPSEMTVSKSNALEALRIREQHLLAAHRARMSYVGRRQTDEAVQTIMSQMDQARSEAPGNPTQFRSTQTNAPVSPSRATTSESPDNRRRRTARRPLDERRPISFASSRAFAASVPQHDLGPYRGEVSLPRGSSSGVSAMASPIADPMNILSHIGGGSGSSSPEAASPAVAVGSNVGPPRLWHRRMPDIAIPNWPTAVNPPPMHLTTRSPMRAAGLNFETGSGTLPPMSPDTSRNLFTSNYDARAFPQFQSNGFQDNGMSQTSRWSR